MPVRGKNGAGTTVKKRVCYERNVGGGGLRWGLSKLRKWNHNEKKTRQKTKTGREEKKIMGGVKSPMVGAPSSNVFFAEKGRGRKKSGDSTIKWKLGQVREGPPKNPKKR